MPKIGSVIEVRMLYCFKGGCLYQPTYIGSRDDINIEECTTKQLKYKPDPED
jgi:bifunctional non-homologous end joining protein LigD